MSYFPRGADVYELSEAQKVSASTRSIKDRRSVECKQIEDNEKLQCRSTLIRCIAHIFCYLIARKFGNILKDAEWNTITFGVFHQQWAHSKSNTTKRAKITLPPVPEIFRYVVGRLNQRSILYDYVCFPMFKQGIAYDNTLLKDYSSYAAVVAGNRFHDVTRGHDEKWTTVADYYTSAFGSSQRDSHGDSYADPYGGPPPDFWGLPGIYLTYETSDI
eukprot:1437098-Pyramimonas_sp.AAC.1